MKHTLDISNKNIKDTEGDRVWGLTLDKVGGPIYFGYSEHMGIKCTVRGSDGLRGPLVTFALWAAAMEWERTLKGEVGYFHVKDQRGNTIGVFESQDEALEHLNPGKGDSDNYTGGVVPWGCSMRGPGTRCSNGACPGKIANGGLRLPDGGVPGKALALGALSTGMWPGVTCGTTTPKNGRTRSTLIGGSARGPRLMAAVFWTGKRFCTHHEYRSTRRLLIVSPARSGETANSTFTTPWLKTGMLMGAHRMGAGLVSARVRVFAT